MGASEEERSNRRRHQLSAFTPFECFLGMPVAVEELVSADDAFEGAVGVHRLRFQAAEALLRVFTSRASGELGVGSALALWPIHQEVAHRFATCYGITELEACYAEFLRLLECAPGRLSPRRWRAAEVAFLDTVSDYVVEWATVGKFTYSGTDLLVLQN